MESLTGTRTSGPETREIRRTRTTRKIRTTTIRGAIEAAVAFAAERVVARRRLRRLPSRLHESSEKAVMLVVDFWRPQQRRPRAIRNPSTMAFGAAAVVKTWTRATLVRVLDDGGMSSFELCKHVEVCEAGRSTR